MSAAKAPDGTFTLHGLDSGGLETFLVPLPGRGHAACGHPTRAEAIGFARRPGRFALVLDCALGQVVHEFAPAEARVFQGHGAYSAAGDLLYVSEQEAEGSRGFVGVYETETYRRIGTFSTDGIGPHEVRLMPDGKHLVIANGGIETRGRDKLNTETMRPSLVYTTLDGHVVDKVELMPELHQNSIRHLSVTAEGLLAFAMQWEGEPGEVTPLVGLHRMGETPVLAEAPLADELAMKGYAGSVAFAGDGSEVAITSPKGGRLHRFGPDGRFLGKFKRTEICGVATTPTGYVASDGLGGIIAFEGAAPRVLNRTRAVWDNHLVAI